MNTFQTPSPIQLKLHALKPRHTELFSAKIWLFFDTILLNANMNHSIQILTISPIFTLLWNDQKGIRKWSLPENIKKPFVRIISNLYSFSYSHCYCYCFFLFISMKTIRKIFHLNNSEFIGIWNVIKIKTWATISLRCLFCWIKCWSIQFVIQFW